MKKIITVVLALTIALTMSLSAFATTETLNEIGSKKIDVNAKFSDLTTTPDCYSVDVQWGKMEFTYTVKGNNKWNKDTHRYTRENSNDGWTSSENAITVTNHSNKSVTAKFTLVNETQDKIDGTFDYNNVTLQSGVGRLPTEADSVKSALTLSGVMSVNLTGEFAKIGYVTVELS